MHKIAFIVLVLFSTITVIGCQKNDTENKTVDNNNVVTDQGKDKAPNFTLESTTGKKVKLSDYKNKIVILDFWATWCPPCRRGIPDLIELQKEFKKDLVIIGISVDTDTKADVIPFIKNYGINYPVVYFTRDVISAYGGINGIPTSFIIDQKGNVVDSHVGLVSKSTLERTIKSLLKNKS